MTLWMAVLAACALAFVTKWLGHLVPAAWLSGTRTRRVTSLLPVALLASLVVVQTLGGPAGTLVIDARVAAVVVAVVALLLRAPFILVVALGAVVAAGLRALGWS
ncbi:MAG TPA: AzlD domain-containing protein [Dermatophilaceae bacterium]|nr:AzlD domain-containing protein [Dermatophilaceae bacterium]HMT89493.1 AzlD domain-containing protein [Dermatophilaceae bacterium]